MSIEAKLNLQREFFESAATRSFEFRIQQLKKLRTIVTQNEQAICDALYKDLNKSKTESWITELSFVHAELKMAISHLKKWMKPKRVSTNLINFPSRSYILPEPMGVVLIIGPWNYPFHLMMVPLISAMASGNCISLKSSEHAAATSELILKLIRENFDEQYIFCAEGDGEKVVGEMMHNFVFDHVFFTGSPAVGKQVYSMAAKNLVPVTLELGGKCPAVVEADANITVAAKRIALAKFFNTGQTCVAPDYVLVHADIKAEFIVALKNTLTAFYKPDPEHDPNYGKIINEKHFDRIVSYLKDGNILMGGTYNRSKLFIAPTLADNVNMDSPIMQEEIFGPLLPIIGYQHRDEALKIIHTNKNPLSFYVFTQHKANAKEWMESVAFGSGCINNAAVQLTNTQLPFGGRGKSGMGRYHGKFGFENFSHLKTILDSPTWFDPHLKYPPFINRLRLFKKIMG